MSNPRPISRRLFAAGGLAPAMRPAAKARPARQPNFVVIFADNLGYGDVGCYGSIIRTLNIDRMAAEGMRFRHGYSASPMCSPSRAALLTGRHPPRTGVLRVLWPYSTDGLPESEVTIAEILKANGYRTACFGKWHLGHMTPHLPMRHGFDEYFGIPWSPDMPPVPLMRGADVIETPARLESLTARITEQAVRFIEASKDAPFFLYVPETAPHPPQVASARFRGKSPAGVYGDVVEEMDWGVGEILGALKRNGLDEKTFVFFVSDNGPMNLGSAGILRGRIHSTYEGGMRVPFIVRCPGTIPAGRVSDQVVSALDILPTVARLCNARLPEALLDGVDISPVLTGSRDTLDREVMLYIHDVHVQCARLGRYKLHMSRYANGRLNLPLRPMELYDVINDPGESYDIAPEHPKVVSEIRSRVERIMAGMPEVVRKAFELTRATPTAPYAVGSSPRPLKSK